MNDPNGLFYAGGFFHLFYQYSSRRPAYETISWGHATSRDLVRWRHRPVALTSEGNDSVYSGSAVIDRWNRSGLGGPTQPPCLAFFTNSHDSRTPTQRQTVDVAYSRDNGWTWQKYVGNPVLDPKRRAFDAPFVFWFAPDRSYRMLVGEPLSWTAWRDDARSRFAVYRSEDLLRWQRVGHIGPFGKRTELWEVPVLVQVPIAGCAGRKWVLLWSVVDRDNDAVRTESRYLVGDFDGRRFHADPGGRRPRRLDWGPDMYAPLPWSHAPGSPVIIAWMSTWTYARRLPMRSWAGGALTIPRRLTLRRSGRQLELAQRPVSALRALRSQPTTLRGVRLHDETRHITVDGIGRGVFELLARWRSQGAQRCGIRVRVGHGQGTEIGIDTRARVVYVDRRRSGNISFAPEFPGVYEAPLGRSVATVTVLRLFVDRSSVEVFVNDGRRVLTAQIFPWAGVGLDIFATGGRATLERLTVWPLESVWTGDASTPPDR